MNDAALPSQTIIWATRGRSWGFRFLLRGGLADPLLEYEHVSAVLGDEPRTFGRVSTKSVVRFPDPESRSDTAGRVIPHQFVVAGDLASTIASVDDAVRLLWPLVKDIYADIWQDDRPPTSEDVEARVDESVHP